MSDKDATDFKAANEALIKDFIGQVDNFHRDIPDEARNWIKEKLANAGPLKNFYKYADQHGNEVVQVDYNFWGKKPQETKEWRLKFTINADMPNKARGQKAHFGGEVSFNDKDTKVSIHKWLPDGMLKIGRPTDKSVELENYPSAPEEHEDFKFGGSINWSSESFKYPPKKT